MEIKYIYAGLLISFVLVLALWVLQRFFRKMKVLYICSTAAFIVILVTELLEELFGTNTLVSNLTFKVFSPGFKIAGVFIRHPLVAFDNLSPAYIILSYIFAVIFYSVVFWGIAKSISYTRKKYFYSKTNGR